MIYFRVKMSVVCVRRLLACLLRMRARCSEREEKRYHKEQTKKDTNHQTMQAQSASEHQTQTKALKPDFSYNHHGVSKHSTNSKLFLHTTNTVISSTVLGTWLKFRYKSELNFTEIKRQPKWSIQPPSPFVQCSSGNRRPWNV